MKHLEHGHHRHIIDDKGPWPLPLPEGQVVLRPERLDMIAMVATSKILIERCLPKWKADLTSGRWLNVKIKHCQATFHTERERILAEPETMYRLGFRRSICCCRPGLLHNRNGRRRGTCPYINRRGST